MVDDQFIVSAVTGLARGQKAKNHRGVSHISAIILIARPNLPRDHRRGGKGGPLSRLEIRQPIVIKYDVKTETLPRELIAFSAVVEPRLMQESNEVITNETPTDRSGRFHPIGT